MLLDIIQDNSNLQVSYWGEDNKTHIEIIKIPDEKQFVWLTSPKDKHDVKVKDVKNWDGKQVYKHRINPFKEKLNRYRQYELLDEQPQELKDKVFSYNIPEMFFIDIENLMQEGKPNPEKPDKPITVIGVCCPNDTIMVLSGGKDLTKKEQESIQTRIDDHFKQVERHFKFVFRYFKTEYDMMYFFFSCLIPKMALMTGWNFEDYDWRYMFNRAKLLGIDPAISSPTHIMTGQVDRPAHVGLVDYLKAYKKWTWNSNENYKLDTIGEKLCKIKKVQHMESLDDMYNNNFEKYVYYNAIDCCLVKLIHETCGALTCGLTTAWLGHIKAMDCFGTTYSTENLLRDAYLKEGKVLAIDPNVKKKEGEKYEGAFVKQPVPGLHKYCTCRDYSSLYPTIIREFNIGPETLVTMLPENNETLKQEWRNKGYIVCASGAVYKKEDGNLKKIITDLYFKRKSYKKTSFKYTQSMYDLKDMIKNDINENEIEDYLNKNNLDNVVNVVNAIDDYKNKVNKIIDYCQTQADIYNNFQMSCKIAINAIYGAFGFSGFYFYNPNIAESVTKQGKNVILNAERTLNLWAQKVWLKDEKTHKKMGIHIIKPDEKMEPVSRYIDTDSVYASYYQVVNTTDWMQHPVWRLTKTNKQNDQKDYTYVSQSGYPTEDDAKKYFNVESIDNSKFEWIIDTIEPGGREFCLTLSRVFMSDFMKRVHDDYAKKNGTESLLDFELEAYNEAGIWLAKKKYIKNMTWAEPNIYYNSCEKIKATGVEIAQTSSSIWVKKQLTDLVKWIFQQEDFVLESFVEKLKKVKQQFFLQSPEIISVNKGMNKYNDYVLSDTDCIELNPKSMVTVQGATLYNYIINNNPKLKKKYSVLFDADKLCVLYIKPTNRYTYWKKETQVPVKDVVRTPDMYKLITNNKQTVKGVEVYTDVMSLQKCEAFSYPAGMYPIDIAENIEIDYARMFELLVLGPINRIIESMGYAPVDISMTCSKGLW